MTKPALPVLRLTPRQPDGAFEVLRRRRRSGAFNPATGEVVASVQPASREQALKAIAAARRAFDEGDWPRMPVFERGQVLRAIADGILARSEDFALLESINGGKPIAGARREAVGAAKVFFTTTPARWTSPLRRHHSGVLSRC